MISCWLFSWFLNIVVSKIGPVQYVSCRIQHWSLFCDEVKSSSVGVQIVLFLGLYLNRHFRHLHHSEELDPRGNIATKRKGANHIALS